MSYHLALWKQRLESDASPAFLYCLIGEVVETIDLEDLDLSAVAAALDQAFPNWRGRDAPFTCDFARCHVSFSVPFSRVDAVVPTLQELARSGAWTLFDPQTMTVPSAEAARAKSIARNARRSELREQEASELAELTGQAEAGDVEAQLRLANRLSTGEGLRKNLPRAFQWYRSAAEGGSTDAMFNLAACYQYGDGITRSLSEAIAWYEKASVHDLTYAPFALGVIYLGFGPVRRDDVKAEGYLRQALEHGHPDAAATLRLLREPEITLEMKKKAWKFWTLRE